MFKNVQKCITRFINLECNSTVATVVLSKTEIKFEKKSQKKKKKKKKTILFKNKARKIILSQAQQRNSRMRFRLRK